MTPDERMAAVEHEVAKMSGWIRLDLTTPSEDKWALLCGQDITPNVTPEKEVDEDEDEVDDLVEARALASGSRAALPPATAGSRSGPTSATREAAKAASGRASGVDEVVASGRVFKTEIPIIYYEGKWEFMPLLWPHVGDTWKDLVALLNATSRGKRTDQAAVVVAQASGSGKTKLAFSVGMYAIPTIVIRVAVTVALTGSWQAFSDLLLAWQLSMARRLGGGAYGRRTSRQRRVDHLIGAKRPLCNPQRLVHASELPPSSSCGEPERSGRRSM
jgi:hypothetical protein